MSVPLNQDVFPVQCQAGSLHEQTGTLLLACRWCQMCLRAEARDNRAAAAGTLADMSMKPHPSHTGSALWTPWKLRFWDVNDSSCFGNDAETVNTILNDISKATPVSYLQFTINFNWVWVSSVMAIYLLFLYQSSFLVPSYREGSHREGTQNNFCKGAWDRPAQIKQLSPGSMKEADKEG